MAKTVVVPLISGIAQPRKPPCGEGFRGFFFSTRSGSSWRGSSSRRRVSPSVLNRKIHYWTAFTVAIPMVVMIGSGLLLQMKKHNGHEVQVDLARATFFRRPTAAPTSSNRSMTVRSSRRTGPSSDCSCRRGCAAPALGDRPLEVLAADCREETAGRAHRGESVLPPPRLLRPARLPSART